MLQRKSRSRSCVPRRFANSSWWLSVRIMIKVQSEFSVQSTAKEVRTGNHYKTFYGPVGINIRSWTQNVSLSSGFISAVAKGTKQKIFFVHWRTQCESTVMNEATWCVLVAQSKVCFVVDFYWNVFNFMSCTYIHICVHMFLEVFKCVLTWREECCDVLVMNL